MRYIKESLFLLILCVFLPTSTLAIGLLRDADIEYSLDQVAKPILQAAGLSPSRIKVLVVDDTKMNAFVIDNNHIFLTAGLILKTKSPEMLQSVIAHEAAHIANGHITRRLQNLRASRTAAGFGMAFAIAAGISSGSGDLATGLAIGLNSSAKRVFLSHSRSEEASADQSAYKYMRRAGVDTRGMKNTLELFEGQLNLTKQRQDPYIQSHPLSRDRLRAVNSLINSDTSAVPQNLALYWHARAVGKLSAFIRSPDWTLQRADKSITQDIKYMRKAVALSRQGKITQAMQQMDQAQRLRPKDPFLMDLRAELLMRARQFQASAQTYAKAASLAPSSPLILAGQGRALLASGNPKSAQRALEKARSRDFKNVRLHQDLAVAYANLGNNGMASLVTAERYALQGKLKDAKLHATRAQGLLQRGTPAWQRAQDVLSAARTK